jgi:hypothetical protein
MKNQAAALFLCLGLLGVQPLLADAPAAAPTAAKKPTIAKRLHHQAKRIKQGEKSGALTKDQAADLRADHQKIKAEVKADRAANGGKLTQDERQDVKGQLNAENQKIIADEQKNGPSTVPSSK